MLSWIFSRAKCLKYTFQQYKVIAWRKFGGKHCTPSPFLKKNSFNSFKIYHRTCKLIVLPGDLLIDEQQWATCLNKVSHLLHKLTFMSMFFNVVCKLVVICFTGGRLFKIYLSDRGRVHFYRNKTFINYAKSLAIRNCGVFLSMGWDGRSQEIYKCTLHLTRSSQIISTSFVYHRFIIPLRHYNQ